ncbi:hypothetical protein ACJMK2_015724 [Sinanodonta woodiana]|uniref:ascorbate ferrireductase (transmembrane) n=1 Tax=Sinanodonta woodiana TaxID=1069815 RepID=A0ABD3URJ8_SINWO
METRRVIYPVLYKSAHIVTITLAAFIVFTAKPGSSLFSWHPTLMAITFLFLTFEAVLVIDSDHSPLVGSSRSTQILFHQIINISSFASAMCGFVAIYYHKDISGYEHFKTWHGTMGVITLVIHFLQIIGGTITKYRYPYVQKLLNLKLNGLDLKIFHSSFGLLLYAVVWLTITCAMFSSWFSEYVTGIWWSICILSAVFLAIVSMHQILLFFILFVQIRIAEMFINGFVAIMRQLFFKTNKSSLKSK